ncbi:MAG: hypothetical protein ABIQ39_01275 [Ilumatobacteraceae bacterium]
MDGSRPEFGSATGGPVMLQVPSDARMGRVARLAASSLAAMARMTIDELEDVKIVVSEVLAALIEHGDGDDITIRFDVADHRLDVSGYTTAIEFAVDGAEIALSATVLAAIASEHSIGHREGQLLIRATYLASTHEDPPASGASA